MKWKKTAKKAKETPKTPSVTDLWPSLGHDLCDSCPQTATVRVFVTHTAMILDFCTHHFRKNKKEFEDKGYMWIDGRHESHKFTSTAKDIHV